MRKELHQRESKWLRSKVGDDRKEMRSKYLEMRQVYSKAVRRVKRSYQRRMQDKLEQELKCPKKFWKLMKKMNVGHKKKGGIVSWKCMMMMATLRQAKRR